MDSETTNFFLELSDTCKTLAEYLLQAGEDKIDPSFLENPNASPEVNSSVSRLSAMPQVRHPIVIPSSVVTESPNEPLIAAAIRDKLKLLKEENA